MSPRSLESPAPALGLSHQSGARAAVYPDGALLFTWWPSQGSEVIFMSERSQPKVGGSPHGGVPIIFPQFGGEGPLPNHGFARNLRWESLPRDTMTTLAMRLADSAATRGQWPHDFTAVYTVTLGDRDVTMQLEVTNAGDAPMRFTGALHTYLRVGDLSSVALCGLDGARYRDRLLGEERVEESSRLAIPAAINRTYFDTPSQLVLDDPSLGRSIGVEADGFTDTVVWNPGEEGARAYDDLAPGDHRHFLCVESACVGTPVEVEPGATWTGRQTLKI